MPADENEAEPCSARAQVTIFQQVFSVLAEGESILRSARYSGVRRFLTFLS